MPTSEMCTHCNSEITPFEQAYLVKGRVVCQLCNDRLLKAPDVADEPELTLAEEDEWSQPEAAVFEQTETGSDFDLALAKKNRRLYLTFFLLVVIGNFVMMATPAGVLIYLPFLVLFLVYFLSTAKIVLGYSTGKRVAIGIGLFIPVVSLILLLCIDTTLYKRIREIEDPTVNVQGPREFCSMGLYTAAAANTLYWFAAGDFCYAKNQEKRRSALWSGAGVDFACLKRNLSRPDHRFSDTG